MKNLLKKQNADGSFVIYPGCDLVYFTAFILSELDNFSYDKNICKVQERAANFLLSRKQKDGKFSDNTLKNFFVISALFEYDSSIFDGFFLGNILKSLVRLEKEVGGPYFDSDMKTIDLATNIQIAYFLSLNNVHLPNLDNFIEKAIIEQNYNSNFYKSAFPLIYILSKFYQGGNRQLIINYLNRNNHSFNKSSLDLLFLFLALKNFSLENKNLKKTILNLQKEITSEEIIKSILLQKVLIPFRNKCDENIISEEKMENKIVKLAEDRFKDLSDDFRNLALSEIQKTMKKNEDKQMFLMPYFFKKALGKKGEIFADNYIAELGLVNVFFWNAFIIYDDFWDEEGIPKKLPSANLYAREFIKFFCLALPENTGFNNIFSQMMDRLDAANTWETLYCRAQIKNGHLLIPEKLPDYSDYTLAFEPASAHILGCMIMLFKLGYDFKSREMNNLKKYFKNYLIAMQINDDAHDWEDDLSKGHLSTVVVMIINEYKKNHPEAKQIDLNQKQELKEIYYNQVIDNMCSLVLDYTQKSRRSLSSLYFLENKYFLEKIINITENVARDTLQEKEKMGQFLKGFSSG